MNLNLRKLLLSGLILLAGGAFYQSRIQKPTILNEHPSNNEHEEESFSGAGKSLDEWSLARSYPSEKIQPKKLSEAHQIKKRLIPTKATSRSDWEPMGPQNFAGRILTLVVDPNNPETLYAGAASGGLWKSTDDGGHWNYVSTGMPLLGVSSIVVNPNNSNEMFIGTGEVYGDFDPNDNLPNQNTGQGYTIRYRRGTYGIGILKTTDGGLNWEYSLDWSQSNELKGVNTLQMSPQNSNVLYAGTTDGLFRSDNNGSTWQNILNFPNVMNIAMHPTNEGEMLVGVGTFESNGTGVYRSEDGINFTPVGLPSFTGKTMLDYSKSDPNIVYASVGNYDETVGLYISTDAGVTWSLANDYDYAKYQGWYSHDVAVNPDNSSIVLVGGINVYRSVNEGQLLIPESDWLLWNLTAFPIEGPEQLPGDFIHADIHDIVYHPSIPNKIYVASDGGVFKSENDGLDFVSANTGLQTAQFYQNFSSSMTDENFAMGGLQDNATAVYRGGLAWERKIGGDGFGTIIDPNDDRNAWGSLYYLRLFFSEDKGESFGMNSGTLPGCFGVDPGCKCNFSAPISFSQSSSDLKIYGASNIVYTITNGTTRTATNSGNPLDGDNPVNCIHVSPTNDNLVFAGTSPLYTSPAKMFKTTNGGDSWEDVTNGLPDRFPMDVKINPCDENIIYVTFGGYDLTYHVFKSVDGGSSWEGVGEDLPDVPTNSIFIDPENTNHIYIGNDIGVFASTDEGDTWINYSSGLPDACIVMSLGFTPATRKLRIATHGNGAYETDMLHSQQNFKAKSAELAEWYQDDFEVSFEDEPSACVFQQCFYTVRDFDGTEWKGNNLKGFISENFEQSSLNQEWFESAGTWELQNGTLKQTNTSNQNTQLNINLTQDVSTPFLYHWKLKFDNNGNEKRAGVHIFADDLNQEYRGNSYLINFLENYDQVRVFKTDENGDYTTLESKSFTMLPDEWYDVKVVYEPSVGRIAVFVNEELVIRFVDDEPLQSGNGLSLRTGAASVSFDDISVYKGRDCSGIENISYSPNGDCRYESPNENTFVCGIQSIGYSNMRGWTSPDTSEVKIGEHEVTIEGEILTENSEAVKNVDVLLENGQVGNIVTDDLGFFQLNAMSGTSFDIRPEKLDGVKNGVNTFDMVLIRKHILGIELLDSPYQLISADVNKNGNITTFDLVKITLVILEMEFEFQNNTSWRFVPSDYVFPTPIDLVNIPDKRTIHQVSGNQTNVDFIAMKVGDVNSSAQLQLVNNQADTRVNEFLTFNLEDKKLKIGEKITVQFNAKDFQDITGYQMTLEFDEFALGFVEARANNLSDLPKEKFGTSKTNNGKLLMNWVSGKPINLEDETKIFQIDFEVKQPGRLSDYLKIIDGNLRSEAYDEEDQFLKIKLDFTEPSNNVFTNIQFSPNPFFKQVQLNLESEKTEATDLFFFDLNGRLLKQIDLKVKKGENQINIDFSDIEYSGLVIFKVKGKNGEGVGKIVKL